MEEFKTKQFSKDNVRKNNVIFLILYDDNGKGLREPLYLSMDFQYKNGRGLYQDVPVGSWFCFAV